MIDNQIVQEGEACEQGIRTKFWQVLKEELERMITESREELEKDKKNRTLESFYMFQTKNLLQIKIAKALLAFPKDKIDEKNAQLKDQ